MKAEERKDFIQLLKTRFGKNMPRHTGVEWPDVQAKLEDNPDPLS